MQKTESQGTCKKEDVLAYVLKTYGTKPDYPWKTPDFVLRHEDNQKWYGLVLEVKKENLGLPGTDDIDILDVKCDPEMAGFLVSGKGILPGYHMNKKNWITILLDGTVEKEQVFSLLDASYLLTASRKSRKATQFRKKKAWMIPANPKYFDLEKAFETSSEIEWHQRGGIYTGDLVYIYMAAPVSAVLYQCDVIGTEEMPDQRKDGNGWNRTMTLKLRHRFLPDQMSKEKMKQYGVGPVRSARSVPPELAEELKVMADADQKSE